MAERVRFATRPIDITAERCLNSRFRQVGCSRCADACPTSAITLDDGAPRLVEGDCAGCGVCLHVCPTDAFQQRHRPETTLRQSVEQMPTTAIGLVCPLCVQADGSSMPAPLLVRHGRCLAGLSLTDLLALTHDGARSLWLDDTICPRCPLGRTRDLLQETADAANTLLGLVERSARVELLSRLADQAPAPTPAGTDGAHRVVDGMQPRFTRRGLFGALGRATQTAVSAPTGEESILAPLPAAPPLARLSYAVPRSRRALLDRLARMAAPSPSPPGSKLPSACIPFASVALDDQQCSACSLCARFCPTGALAFHQEDGQYRLDFRSDTCIDCAICQVACPTDALGFDAEIDGADLLAGALRTLGSGDLEPCCRCGVPSRRDATNSGASLCYVCRGSRASSVRLFPTDVPHLSGFLR